MHIHHVKCGEDILSISAKYKVLPTKLIDDNGISREALVPGEEILIVPDTEAQRIKAGESLYEFALRNNTKERTILRNNPALSQMRIIPAGKILTIKIPHEIPGYTCTLGIVDKECTTEKIKASLPFTDIYIVDYLNLSSRIHILNKAKEHIQLIKKFGTSFMLGFSFESEFIEDYTAQAEAIKKLCIECKFTGAIGVVLFNDEICDGKIELCKSFILHLQRELIDAGLKFFICAPSQSLAPLQSLCDGIIIKELIDDSLSKATAITTIEKFSLASDIVECYYMPVCEGLCGGQALEIPTLLRLAAANGKKLCTHRDSLVMDFRFIKFTPEGKKSLLAKLPTLANLKRIFNTGYEMGLNGFAFKVSKCPIAYYTLLNYMFCNSEANNINPLYL